MQGTPALQALGALCAATLAMSGCVLHSTSPAEVATRESLAPGQSDSVPVFSYQRTDIPFKNRVLDEEGSTRYRVRYVRFPSIGDNGQADNLVRGRYYESVLPGRKPLVVVLPIWSGHLYPSVKTAAHLRRRSAGSINIFVMEGEGDLIDWQALASAVDEAAYLELWEEGARREWVTITDIRRVLDWAATRSDLDPDRTGLVGFSHGALVAAAVAAQEPRLAATVLVMGGALAHQVIARCPLDRSAPAKGRAFTGFGWDLEQLEERLEPIFAPLDSASYPNRVDPGRVLIVEAGRDECMPETSREALWQAMGRPERVRLPYRHKQAFLTMTPLGFNWLRRRIGSFLEEAFENPVDLEPVAGESMQGTGATP